MTAFLLVLVYRTYRVTKEANIDVLKERRMKMNSNLLVLPILLPLLCALVLVLLKRRTGFQKFCTLEQCLLSVISLCLLIYVLQHKPITLDFGGWAAPYGIQFLGDSLSLVMVTVASFVVTLIMSYGFGRRSC